MPIIDSNKTCNEILNVEDTRRNAEFLNSIKCLYHYSNETAINNIYKSKIIWFTPFENQKSESVFKPCHEGVFYTACFSIKSFSNDEIEKFKGTTSIEHYLIFNFDDINNLFDKDQTCTLVFKDNSKQQICFVGHTPKFNDDISSDYANKIFIRIKNIFVEYSTDNINISNLYLDDGDTMSISSNVGKKVKSKYDYQNEIKIVAELMSTNEIKISDIERIEIHINNSIKIEKFNIK